MHSNHRRPAPVTLYETAYLVRKAQGKVGEDNVAPWLRVHDRLVEAAVRGYRMGLQAAIRRAREERN